MGLYIRLSLLGFGLSLHRAGACSQTHLKFMCVTVLLSPEDAVPLCLFSTSGSYSPSAMSSEDLGGEGTVFMFPAGSISQQPLILRILAHCRSLF